MMPKIRIWLAGAGPLDLARKLLLAELVALLFSTSAAVGIEFLLYLLFACSAPLRGRLRLVAGQPMVLMTLIWALVVAGAGFYSVATVPETLASISSWRKLLLLPMAAAVFTCDLWKGRLIWALLWSTLVGVILSFASWISGVVVITKFGEVGVVISNHSTQGMVFAVSLFCIVMLLRYPEVKSVERDRLLRVGGLLLLINLIFITPGRSGYLVLLVVATVAAFYMVSGRSRYLLGLGVPLAIATLLYLSPLASQRIMLGVSEIRNYQESAELTSMGVRMAMWKNTAELVIRKPWFGYGTGGFPEAYRREVAGQSGWQGQPVDDCHNQFLRIVAEQGLLGLAVFLLFIGSFFRQRAAGVFRILGLGVLLAWCATSMFSAHFSTFIEGRFLYLWCGAQLAENKDEEEETASLP